MSDMEKNPITPREADKVIAEFTGNIYHEIKRAFHIEAWIEESDTEARLELYSESLDALVPPLKKYESVTDASKVYHLTEHVFLMTEPAEQLVIELAKAILELKEETK